MPAKRRGRMDSVSSDAILSADESNSMPAPPDGEGSQSTPGTPLDKVFRFPKTKKARNFLSFSSKIYFTCLYVLSLW